MGVYHQLKDKVTPSGVTLFQCMKTGVDNPGHPHIKTVGLVAGDEESYDTFAALFDPVTCARHGGYPADAKQPTDMDISKLKDIDIDPYNKYVLTSVGSSRSWLPPHCSTWVATSRAIISPCTALRATRPNQTACPKSKRRSSAQLGIFFRSRTLPSCSPLVWAVTGPMPAAYSPTIRRTSSCG